MKKQNILTAGTILTAVFVGVGAYLAIINHNGYGWFIAIGFVLGMVTLDIASNK